MSTLSTEEKRRRLAENRKKALQRRAERAGSVGPNDGKTSLTGSSSKRDATTNRTIRKMINKSDYIQYDILQTKDSKGGFIVGGERKNGEKSLDDWREEKRKEKEFKAPDPAPPVDLKSAPKCYECGTIDINQEYFKVYGCRVCNKCKENMPEKYSLLTKTECKQDYFMTDSELMDPKLFNKIEKPNPHAKFSRMQLFLRYQIEEFAFKKWNGPDGLDQEWLRRQQMKVDKKKRVFETKLKEMRKRTRAEEYTKKIRERDHKTHVHEWRVKEGGRRCIGCGFEVEEEVL